MWMQNSVSSVFQSQSFDWFVSCLTIIVLPSHEHNSLKGMRWISCKLLGGYGLFFLLLGAFFPSWTSCLVSTVKQQRYSVRSHRLDFCCLSPGPVGCAFLIFFLCEFKEGMEWRCFSSTTMGKQKHKNPNRWLWREMVALLVVAISMISCHAAGRRALGASNTSICAAVFRGGKVVGNWLSLRSRARAPCTKRRKKSISKR